MPTEFNYLFNFSASCVTGGLKRLYEYLKWFNIHGGAAFIIHESCNGLSAEFPLNRYFFVKPAKVQRLFNDCGYLKPILAEIGEAPELYYSYGIPIYSRVGKCNWFQLCNVLTLGTKGIPLSATDHLKWFLLGLRIRGNFRNADVVSAESAASVSLIRNVDGRKLFISVNGSDDELMPRSSDMSNRKDNVATVVGTCKYKALADSIQVFQMLRGRNPALKLVVIGQLEFIDKKLLKNKDVIFKGSISRNEVVDCLRNSRFYISTTRVEGSYNAASEGVFLADESFISDIGPHQELLVGMPYERVSVPDVYSKLIHVRRDSISTLNLKSWNSVITEMILRMNQVAENQRSVS